MRLIILLLAAGAVLSSGNSGFDRTQSAAPASGTIQLAFGGDVSPALEIHAYAAAHGHESLVRDVPLLRDADLAIANLEAVIASVGDAGAEKSQDLPYYFRGRPEMAGALRAIGLDIVGTANNHVGDYGDAAVLQQGSILDSAGLLHAGSGRDRAEACAPVLVAVEHLDIALFSIDSTEPAFAAGPSSPGTCHIGLEDDEAWTATLQQAIVDVRRHADVVLVAAHWGPNYREEPVAEQREAGRRIIDLGADAVLGTSSHLLQGVEVHDGRPIIHDAGNLLMHFAIPYDAAVFDLSVSQRGVERISVVPVISEPGMTRAATAQESERILRAFEERSAKLGTSVQDGEILLDPPEREVGGPATGVEVPPAPDGTSAEADASPPPQCTVDAVPENAAISPIVMGPVELVGYRAEPTETTFPRMVSVETFWRVPRPLDGEASLSVVGHPRDGGQEWRYDHEGCDWAWPTTRWEPGTIYRDFVLLRPVDAVGVLDATRFLLLSGPVDLGVEVRDHRGSVVASGPLATLQRGMSMPARYAAAALAAGALAAAAAATFLAIRAWRRRGGPRRRS